MLSPWTQWERPELCPTCGKRHDPGRTRYCDRCGNKFSWAGGRPAEPTLRFGEVRHPAITAAAISNNGAGHVFQANSTYGNAVRA